MKTFHIDEPSEIGKKRIGVSPKEMILVKQDLKERIREIRKKLKHKKKNGI